MPESAFRQQLSLKQAEARRVQQEADDFALWYQQGCPHPQEHLLQFPTSYSSPRRVCKLCGRCEDGNSFYKLGYGCYMLNSVSADEGFKWVIGRVITSLAQHNEKYPDDQRTEDEWYTNNRS